MNYTNANFLYNNEYLVDTGFFSLNFQSSLIISKQSTISNCRGAIASVLYATGSSRVTIDETKILNSKSQTGSVLYFTMTDTIKISNSMFFNNS